MLPFKSLGSLWLHLFDQKRSKTEQLWNIFFSFLYMKM